MSTNLFSFIKSSLEISTIVEEYTSLKKIGNYLKGVCPFHHERTASFTVSPHREIFYCFGCHVGGDIISFIQKIENCNALEAAKFLIEKYNITPPEQYSFKENLISSSEKERYYALCAAIAEWCHKQLIESTQAFNYLKKRGLNEKSILDFKLGYFPGGIKSTKSLTNFIQNKNFLLKDLLEAKIILETTKGIGYYSPFEERIIFPIKDNLGKYCAFGGRIYNEQDDRPKYYNSHDHIYFSKGELIFGLDIARKSAQATNTLFLTEGYLDAIMLRQYGYENSIATLGSAFTIEHLKLISRYSQRLYIMYDGDNAGQKAILKLTQLCWDTNIDLLVVKLPEKEDPASFLLNQGNLSLLIEKAQDIFVFFVESLTQDFFNKTLQERLNLLKKLLEGIKIISDPLKQDLLLQKASIACNISCDTLKEYMLKKSANIKTNIKAIATIDNNPILPNKISLLEKRLFCAILNKIKDLESDEKEELINLLPPPLPDIIKKIEIAGALHDLTDTEKSLVSKLILEADIIQLSTGYNSVIEHFKKILWKQKVQTIKMELTRAQDSNNQILVQELIKKFELLKTKIVCRDKV